MTPDPALALADGLTALAATLAPGGRSVHGLKRLSAGATQELWRFEVHASDGGVTPLVLRRAPGGDRLSETAAGMEAEAALIAAAADAGVPTPPVRHVLQPQERLGRGFVMDLVEGETLGGRIVREEALAGARVGLARQCGEILARIHAVSLRGLPQLKTYTPVEGLAQWEETYRRAGRGRPVFELALRWLETHAPPPAEPRLAHGDFRNGNLVVGPDGVRAVLDWELAHLGDPREDLGWICVPSWRFGRHALPVGGFGEREDLYAGYEAAGGAAIDRAAMRWWEVFGSLRWGAMCASMVGAFRTSDPSVERAVIARRASETEADLLTLLDAA